MQRSRRTAALAGITIALAVAAGACSSDDGDEAATTDAPPSSTTSTTAAATVNDGATVDISEFQFAPGDITIAAGETVTWINDGSSRHTVTAEPAADGTQLFASDPVQPEQSFVQSFSTPGEYPYFCSIHPDRMSGTIIVE